MGQEKNVLILCTGNSARSILAEAILNKLGAGRFKAFSAGSKPKGRPHPGALTHLKREGYDIAFARSKSWEEFAGTDAPQMDFIVTVCDSAAGEACPVWPGHPAVAHWGIPDPDGDHADDAEERAAFEVADRRLTARITRFLDLPLDTLEPAELKEQLAAIGRIEDDADAGEAS